MFQPENAIPISSWYSSTKDRELYKLMSVLTKMAELDDVRITKKEFDNLMAKSPAYSPRGCSKSPRLPETPGRTISINTSRSRQILVNKEELKLNLPGDRSTRNKTHRQLYRPSVKRAHLNQLFQPGDTQSTWSRKMNDKRTSSTSRKKIITKNIDFWKMANLGGTLKTPKHSIKSHGKLFLLSFYCNFSEIFWKYTYDANSAKFK